MVFYGLRNATFFNPNFGRSPDWFHSLEVMMKTLFKLALIIELLYGVGFIAMPGTILGIFGVTLIDFGTSLTRLFGSALLGFVVLLWFGIKSAHSETDRVVLATMFTYTLLSTVILFFAQLAGHMNVMGWMPVVMHFIFMIAFGLFLFRR